MLPGLDDFKIGIFGWTGTGKTTYISVLYYLASKNLIENALISASCDEKTNLYLSTQINDILLSNSWTEVSQKISGTLDERDLIFDISIRGGRKRKVHIKDYRGEDVKVGEKNESLFDEFLYKADAILFFLDASVNESLGGEFNRLNEFNTFLGKVSNVNNKIKMSVFLVITKSDLLFSPSDVDYDKFTSLAESLYPDVVSSIKLFASDFEVYFISSKYCFERFVLNNASRDGDCSEIFAAPIVKALKLSVEKNKKKKNNMISVGFLFILLIIGGIYFSLNEYLSYKIKSLTDLHPSVSYDQLIHMKDNSWLLDYFPIEKDRLDRKIENSYVKMEEYFFNIIKSNDGGDDYNAVISACDNYLKRFPDTERSKDVLKIKSKFWREAEQDRVKVIEGHVPDYSSVINSADMYLKDFPAGFFRHEVEKYREEAILVRDISVQDELMYNEIIRLCSLYTGMFPNGKYGVYEKCSKAEEDKKRQEAKSKYVPPSQTGGGSSFDVFSILIMIIGFIGVLGKRLVKK